MKVLLALSAVTAAATTVNAQVAPAKPDSACTTYPGGRVECRVYKTRSDSAFRKFTFAMDSAMAKRAALGVEVRATGTKRDTLGIFIDAVTPKGPAESAGIVEGDRIAAINGVDLRTPTADTEDSYIAGLAAHRLTREVQKLTPGSRVSLRVYSGGRFRDVQVTAGRASDVMGAGRWMGMPGMGGAMRFEGPGAAMMFGPEAKMFRERLEPLMKERMEPLMRERLRDLPMKIQLRSPMRFKTIAPLRLRSPQIYKVEADLQPDEPLDLEGDLWDFDEPFDLGEPLEFKTEIEEVSPDTVRELVSTAARDARVALARLAAAGIA